MSNLLDSLNDQVAPNNESLQWLTKGVLVAVAIGALGLYLMIPERKRKNLLK